MTSRKILIVESYGDLLDLLGEAVAVLGWEATLAASGCEALDKLKRQTLPGVVLLNLRTPVMNGIKLLGLMKAHPVYRNIPILAASGQCSGLSRECCLALGFDEFVGKPLAFAELEMSLNRIVALEKRRMLRASEPVSLGSNVWQPAVRGGSPRRVAWDVQDR
jgi:CheY-like chemotaxis protein